VTAPFDTMSCPGWFAPAPGCPRLAINSQTPVRALGGGVQWPSFGDGLAVSPALERGARQAVEEALAPHSGPPRPLCCSPIPTAFLSTRLSRSLPGSLVGCRSPGLGIAIDEYAEQHERGDFLVRSVIGADSEAGTLSIGDVVEVGQAVRFQVRDAMTAASDLDQLLARFGTVSGIDAVGGVLLFSCNGRGAAFFGTADHDVRAVRRALAPEAVGGSSPRARSVRSGGITCTSSPRRS
jgi:hypothetical protein